MYIKYCHLKYKYSNMLSQHFNIMTVSRFLSVSQHLPGLKTFTGMLKVLVLSSDANDAMTVRYMAAILVRVEYMCHVPSTQHARSYWCELLGVPSSNA